MRRALRLGVAAALLAAGCTAGAGADSPASGATGDRGGRT
jgi:hypothetical protein